MNEVTKAAQTMQLVVSDLESAVKAAHGIQRPEGLNMRDRALAAYLAECLDAARRLQDRLLVVVD